MNRFCNFLFVVCVSCYFKIQSSEGLRCWTCENTDLKNCILNGKPEQCDNENEHACQTEIRMSGGKPLIVKTGCKQGNACKNNNRQNPGAAWNPTQCNRGYANSVCRCCCAGPLCNKRKRYLLCDIKSPRRTRLHDPMPGSLQMRMEKVCPEYPPHPVNGKRTCQGGISLRSFCKFTCNEGYTMFGRDLTVCVQRGNKYIWNRSPPTCERTDICRHLPKEPKNGFMECGGDGELGTVCGFACNFGYSLRGSATTICVQKGKFAGWSHETPVCLPFCEMSELSTPLMGARKCTGEGEIGTICSFQCNEGYKMKGYVNSVCIGGENGGKWTHPTRDCLGICTHDLETPWKGHMTCEGEGEVGTACYFTCQEHYKLIGERVSVCQDNSSGPNWNNEPPKCEPLCRDFPESPEYGKVECSGRELGAACSFQCQYGTRLVGETSTTCVRMYSDAIWLNESPICEPICTSFHDPPQNGSIGCEGDGKVGTACDFECDIGFRLLGNSSSECIRISDEEAMWSCPPPICSAICHIMPEAPENGQVVCDGDGSIGTSCVFICDDEYEIVGESTTTCESVSGGAGWSTNPARCKPIPKCEMDIAPENGKIICEGTGESGTNCRIFCDADHKIEGNNSLTCFRHGDEAFWDNEIPICQEIEPECSPIGDLPHGRVVCDSDVLRKGTTCKFECSEVGYELLSQSGSDTKCIGQGKKLNWSAEKPCCVECKNVQKDIVIAMDSSGSISPKNWEKMKEFVINIVRKFNVSNQDVQFCVFQFSTSPRSDGLMYFGRYKKYQLIQQIGKMKRMASGTETGKGLEYAQKRLMDRTNRKDVDDMIWVLTDGETEDMDKLEKASKRLRRKHVEILALAINPTENFVEQMTKMTGSKDNVLVAPNMQSLGAELASRVAVKICKQNCP